MPKRMSIEVVFHSDDDVRIVVDDNGLKRRERWDNGVFAMESLHNLLTQSHVHQECVFIEDEDGRRYPCSLGEWYRAQNRAMCSCLTVFTA